ncbi:MAG: hypothetical protein WD995_09745 [Gemmatimonadota bacterium]
MRSIRSCCVVLGAFALLVAPFRADAQQAGEPVLRGQVLVGDTALTSGTVVLHEVTSSDQGEVDSVTVAGDGTFTFRLPSMPSRVEDRFYFASLRHAGILYFGTALADSMQLDSIYEIQAYDTLMAPEGGHDLALQARNIFFEPNGEEWRVTDIFQLRNDEGRTLVAPEGGYVWRYPLLEGARQFSSGQGDFSLEGTVFDEGAVSVRAAIAPGERVFVFRYTVDDPFGPVPTPGRTEAMDLLVREPSPRVGVEGLELVGRVEVEAGSTYRRYSGVDVGPGQVLVVESEQAGDLPVEWITVLVGLALALAAVFVLRSRDGLATAGGPEIGEGPTAAQSRQALLVEVARLDEAFESNSTPSDQERAAYEARRDELLRRLRSGS